MNSELLDRPPPHDLDAERGAEIAELLAEIVPHIRRVEAVARRTNGPARVALDCYTAAGLDVVLALKRERLGVPRG